MRYQSLKGRETVATVHNVFHSSSYIDQPYENYLILSWKQIGLLGKKLQYVCMNSNTPPPTHTHTHIYIHYIQEQNRQMFSISLSMDNHAPFFAINSTCWITSNTLRILNIYIYLITYINIFIQYLFRIIWIINTMY